jgi:hypothetical protein
MILANFSNHFSFLADRVFGVSQGNLGTVPRSVISDEGWTAVKLFPQEQLRSHAKRTKTTANPRRLSEPYGEFSGVLCVSAITLPLSS